MLLILYAHNNLRSVKNKFKKITIFPLTFSSGFVMLCVLKNARIKRLILFERTSMPPKFTKEEKRTFMLPFRIARIKKNMTAIALAELLQIQKKSVLGSWENGNTTISASMWMKMLRTLNVDKKEFGL